MSAVVQNPFFDQIGIMNVVWLDDLFDPHTTPNTIDIAEQVAVAIAASTDMAHSKLSDLTAADSAEEWARRIQERLRESEIDEFLNQIRPPRPEGTNTVAVDYSPGELESVVSSLGSAVQRIGLSRWAELRQQLIAAAAGGVFLVDRERFAGGDRTNVGDEIVRELISGCTEDVIVVVLTHSVGPEGTENLRRALATELQIPVWRLGVVSKRSADASLTDGIRAAVRVTLTQLTCAIVTNRIVSAMRNSIEETVSALNDLPVSALDRAVFENSLTEGASEIDVLSRILLIRQRTGIDAHMAGALDEIHSPLARMRKLRLLQPLPEVPAKDTRLVLECRRDEVFLIGEILNALRSPLACGDVFLKDGDGAKKYYVLLGQPCDMAVRHDGARSAHEGVFVKLAPSSVSPVRSEGRFFDVPPLEGQDAWTMDFRSWVSVRLDCLEWASFNSDGRVAFTPLDRPPIGLLPGWERRFEDAKNKFQPGRQYCLSLGEIPRKIATASAASVEFPYRRVARLRAPRAVGAYAAFASYHARAAFEHDFAKGVDEPAKAPEPPTSTE
ncbi:MAG: hypothetical protein ACRD4X_14335 [Candidatus Acidiferrales bacterium]